MCIYLQWLGDYDFFFVIFQFFYSNPVAVGRFWNIVKNAFPTKVKFVLKNKIQNLQNWLSISYNIISYIFLSSTSISKSCIKPLWSFNFINVCNSRWNNLLVRIFVFNQIYIFVLIKSDILTQYTLTKCRLNSSRRVATLGEFCESTSSSAWVDK